MLVFWGGGDVTPGWLVDCLAEFSSRGINLTRIESRPRRIGLGHYMFFCDLVGPASNPGVAAAIAGLRGHCEAVRVLGSFPTAGESPASPSTLRPAMATAVPPAPVGSVPLVDHQRHGSTADGSGRWSGGRVLVLNATYEPINVCTVRRATVLLLKEKAEVIEIGPHDLHWARGSMTKPVVIRLVTYVRIPRDSHKRKITRRAVFARDGWQCMYCGARDEPHRRPRHPALEGRRLGLGEHRRLLRAVQPPQGRPAARTRSNMHPRIKPRMPSPNVFIQLASPTIPATWKQYLLPEAA